MYYEGSLRILKTESLSAEEAEVEARFAALVQSRLDEIIAEYEARFGGVIDTDRAREFSPDYCASKASRTRFSRAVYRPAKALADEIYRREIRKGAPAEPRRILFTSGGTGAGKSTTLGMLAAGSESRDPYDVLVDGTLSDYASARAKIRQALAFGHNVAIVHVHRAFAEAVRMVVRRAIEMGRAVTLDNIAATHFRSAETLFQLADEFGARIGIRVVENSGEQHTRTISMDELAATQARSVDQLCKLAHTLLANEFDRIKADHPEIHEALIQKGSRR